MNTNNDVRYAGFFVRFIASLIDTFVVAFPIAIVIYFASDGEWFDFATYKENIQYALSGNAIGILNQPTTDAKWEIIFEALVFGTTALFWRRWMGATPGKHFVGIKVVNKDTFQIVTTKESIIRIVGYFVTAFLFFIAIPMMLIRKDKRTIHDLLAGSAVVYTATDEKRDNEGEENEE